MQGFGLARPMALSDTFAWLETQGAGMPRSGAGRHLRPGGMTPRTAIARDAGWLCPTPAGKVPTTPKTPLDLYPPLLLNPPDFGHEGHGAIMDDQNRNLILATALSNWWSFSSGSCLFPPRPRFPRIPTPSPPQATESADTGNGEDIALTPPAAGTDAPPPRR